MHRTQNARQLRKDIRNSLYDVFGFQENCSNFCQKGPKSKTLKNENVEEESDNDDVFDDQAEFGMKLMIMKCINRATLIKQQMM